MKCPSCGHSYDDRRFQPVEPAKRIRFVGGGWEGILDIDIGQWADAYPACDVSLMLRQAAAWLTANPTKAPKSNYARFLVNWFKREQDRGGTGVHGRPTAADPRQSAAQARRADRRSREYGESDDACARPG